MNATKNIVDNLRAMGASPTVTTDERGNDHIRINAPALDYTATLFDSDAAENDYMIETGKKNA